MSDRRHIVGAVDFFEKNPWAKQAFGGVHAAGTTVLSMFGAGAAVKPLTDLEAKEGMLPDWAKGFGASADSSGALVDKPDYAIVVRGQKADIVAAPLQVVVLGGKRFDGNGYKAGDGLSAKKISFGYDKPGKVMILPASGDKYAVDGPDKVLLLGGTEATTTIKGYTMSESILGKITSKLRRAVAPKSKKKSISAAAASATAAAKRAQQAGAAAVSGSKKKPKQPSLKGAVTKISGDIVQRERKLDREYGDVDLLGSDPNETFTLIQRELDADKEYGTVDLLGRLDHLEILGLDGLNPALHVMSPYLQQRAVFLPPAPVEILGSAQHLEICGAVGDHLEILGVSAALKALAAKKAASAAKLAELKRRAAQAPALVAKAQRSVDKHEGLLMTHAQKADAAASNGQAAVDRGRAAEQAIADQLARVKKLGVKIGGDAADMKQAYERVPGDAVLFTAGKAFDNGALGSWSMYYGPVAPTGTRIGYGWDGTQWVFVGITSTGSGVQANPIPLPGSSTQGVSRLSTGGQIPQYAGNALSAGSTALAGGTFGPLVGDPNNPDYANLRYAPLDDKWFWLADEAPAYATRERDEALALLQKQEDEANAAADAAAQAAADQAQAQIDADTAAMNAKYDLQQAELARQAEIAEQAQEIEDQKLQAELDAQQAREDAQIRQATVDYALQHLDEGMAQEAAQQDGGGYSDDGGAPPDDAAPSDEEEMMREINRG